VLAGGVFGGGYWSSSQSDATNAWGTLFTNGVQFTSGKNLAGLVRPVRAF